MIGEAPMAKVTLAESLMTTLLVIFMCVSKNSAHSCYDTLAWLTNGVIFLMTSVKWTASLIKSFMFLGLVNRLAPYTASRLES